MKQMLRKRELVEAVNVPKSTAADWIIEFHMFIPTTKEGSVTYYRPEGIPVLQTIKQLREKNYAKPEILKELSKRFSMTIDGEAAKDMAIIMSEQPLVPDLLKGLVQIANRSKQHTDLLQKHHTRFNDQDKRFEHQEDEIQRVKIRLDEVINELAITNKILRNKKKPWWKFKS
jgi:DNA-binding transcriptional MerR regulator